MSEQPHRDEPAPRPPLLDRLTTRTWVLVDVVAAVGMMLCAVFDWGGAAAIEPSGPATSTWQVALCALAILPVAIRRLSPLVALGITVAASATATATGWTPFELDTAFGLVMFSVATLSSLRVSRIAIVAAEVAVAAGVVWSILRGDHHSYAPHTMLVGAVLWLVGNSLRTGRAYAADVASYEAQRQNAMLEQERSAVRRERVTIAREVHDIVAHTLTVVTMQAGIAHRLAAERPDDARATLGAIERAGRTAQEELSMVVALLRDEESAPAALTPAPTLADLDDLVDQVRRTGTSVELRRTGALPDLSPAVQLSLFRITQEALTNVVKHGASAAARVELATDPSHLRLEVTNVLSADAGRRPAATGSPQGHGITGMRERAATFGGVVDVGPVGDGEFRVRVIVPSAGSAG